MTPAPADHAQLTPAMASIHHSFTAEASAILAEAVADATRRRHPHVTPLHVAAALISSPSSLLRHMCTMQHHHHHPINRLPAHVHPILISCRALDLCFSIALDRIASIDGSSPAFSNALVASLKRAQAIQRRGSPDHPLLAIKVDLPHLTISVLDDPSVSRVMSEAGFSSLKVKSSVLQYIGTPKQHVVLHRHRQIGLPVSGYRHEVIKAADVIMRDQKRNPVLVGDSGADFVMEEILSMMRRGEFGDLRVISVGDSLSRAKTSELPEKIRSIVNSVSFKLVHNKGVVLDLGDLKWLVEAPINNNDENRKLMIANARSVISEVAAVLRQERRRMWLVGTATCATYLKCQVYHPNMEIDWELQALPIVPRSFVGVTPPITSYIEPSNASNGLTSCISNIGLMPLINRDESPCIGRMHLFDQCNSRKDAPQGEETLNGTITEITDNWQLQLMPTSPGSNSSTGRHHISSSNPTVQTDLSLGLAPFSAVKHKSGPNGTDTESQVKFFKELFREVNWQPEAARSVASVVSHGSNRSGQWLLFKGPDCIGKRKMARALSTLLFSDKPACFNLSRGSTELDRIVAAVKINPSRVILIDGIDRADAVVRTAVRKAITTGRIFDSCNREIGGLESTIFVVITGGERIENDYTEPVNWHLVLSIGGPNYTRKRRADERVQNDEKKRIKSRTSSEPLSLDLNLCTGSSSSTSNDDEDVDGDDEIRDNDDGSDLTDESGHNISHNSDICQLLHDFTIDFRPFDVDRFRRTLSTILSEKFTSVMNTTSTLQLGIEQHVIDRMTDVVLYSDEGGGMIRSFEQWADTILVPAFEQLKSRTCLKDCDRVHLSVVEDQELSYVTRFHGTQLLPVSVVLASDSDRQFEQV